VLGLGVAGGVHRYLVSTRWARTMDQRRMASIGS
jgi:hypothetical protein